MSKTKTISTVSLAAIAAITIAAASPYFYDVSVDESLPTSAMAEETMEKTMAEKEMMKLKTYSGMFVGAGDGVHDAKGNARTFQTDDGAQFLRLENFESTNGPDLYVYLATDEKATDFVSLGMLKGNIGNQNYDIPEGSDLSKYNKVLIWCKAFGVLFGSAQLA